MLTAKSTWLMVRARPYSLSVPLSVERARHQLSLTFSDPFVAPLNFLPSVATRLGAFDGSEVRLSVIVLEQRGFIRPELHAQLVPSAEGCTLVGVLRYDPAVRALSLFGATWVAVLLTAALVHVLSSPVAAVLFALLVMGSHFFSVEQVAQRSVDELDELVRSSLEVR
jgi:hypothetical protein